MKKLLQIGLIAVLLSVLYATPVGASSPFTVFTDESDFLAAIEDLYITRIDFDRFPDGSSVPTGFLTDGTPIGFTLTGDEWASLGITFTSPVGATLSTVNTIQELGPPYYINDLFVSDPNSLNLGAPPYIGPMGTPDDNDDDLIIHFEKPVKAAGIWFIDSFPSSPTEQ